MYVINDRDAPIKSPAISGMSLPIHMLEAVLKHLGSQGYVEVPHE
jgi:hypothetical protein